LSLDSENGLYASIKFSVKVPAKCFKKQNQRTMPSLA
jgi:hypothetical protein